MTFINSDPLNYMRFCMRVSLFLLVTWSSISAVEFNLEASSDPFPSQKDESQPSCWTLDGHGEIVRLDRSPMAHEGLDITIIWNAPRDKLVD